MVDKSFNQRMVDNSRSFNRSPNDFVSNMIDKRNAQILSTFAETQKMEPQYRNFKYEYDALKFIDDNRKDIYWYSKDPREEANKQYLGSLIHTVFPDLPEEYAINHATQLIGDVAGDDMSATNVLQVFGKKVQEGFADAFLGMKMYFKNYGSLIEEEYTDTPDEIKQKHRQELQRDIEEAEKRRVRTDYYSQEFNSLLDQMVLSAADFVPSMALSMVPEILGGVVAKVAMAAKFMNAALKFKRLGQGVSAIMAGLMEAGSITKDLIKAGASASLTNRVANGVGVINGLLEYAGDLPEKKLTDQILGLKKLKQSVDGLSVSATKGTFTDIAKRAGLSYLAGMVTEPATEIAQEAVSMYAMNLASRWQELNQGKSFTAEFTYTPQQFADALWEVGTSTVKGQALIGIPFAGGAIVKKWNAVSGARKFSTYDSSSAFTENDSVYTNPNTKPFTPNTVEKDGVKQAELVKPANVVAINGKLYPVSADDESRAAYMKTKSKGGMYVNIVDGSEFKSEAKANQEQASTFVANFRDKDTAFFVDKNGDIEVNTQDFTKAIEDAINLLGSEYTGIKDESTKDVKKATIFTKDMSYTITDNIAPDAEAVTTQSAYMQMLKDKGDRIAYVKKNFESELNKLFTRAGYKGEALTKAVEDYKALASRLDGTATNLVEEIKKLNPNADPDLQEQIVYGITGMVAEFAPVLDFSSDWARDHVVLDDKVYNSVGKDGKRYAGNSYWEVGGKKYQNYFEIPTEIRTDANFHIALSELLDQTTGIHEIGHMALSMGEQKFLKDDYFKVAFYDALREDNKLLDKNGNVVKDENGEIVYKPENEWTIGDETHEAFAEKLEAYINDGVADSKEEANLFKRILRAWKVLFDKMSNSLTRDQREFYDRLFGNLKEDDTATATNEKADTETTSAENDELDEEFDEADKEVGRQKTFRMDNLSDSEKDTLYQNFYDSYVKATGSAWDKDDFNWKAGKWTFFGSENGGIALRKQNSGMWKLNASYGSTKEIYNGLKEMYNTIGNQPIWGAMTENIANLLEKASKRFGDTENEFTLVPPSMTRIIAPSLSKVLGANVTVNRDGTLTALTPNGQEIKKVLVANGEYFRHMADTIENNPEALPFPRVIQNVIKSKIESFYDKRYKKVEEVGRHKLAIDYLNDNRYNWHRIQTGRYDRATAFSRDVEYMKDIISDINYIADKELDIKIYENVYNENLGDDEKVYMSLDDMKDYDNSFMAQVFVEMPKLEQNKWFAIEEYLNKAIDPNNPAYNSNFYTIDGRQTHTVPLRNGFDLTFIAPDELIDVPSGDEYTREEMVNIIGTMQDREIIQYGNLLRITGQHGLGKFEHWDERFVGTGTSHQSYGARHYTSSGENVTRGYRRNFSEKAQERANEELYREIESKAYDVLKDAVIPKIESFLDTVRGNAKNFQMFSFDDKGDVVGDYIDVSQELRNKLGSIAVQVQEVKDLIDSDRTEYTWSRGYVANKVYRELESKQRILDPELQWRKRLAIARSFASEFSAILAKPLYGLDSKFHVITDMDSDRAHERMSQLSDVQEKVFDALSRYLGKYAVERDFNSLENEILTGNLPTRTELVDRLSGEIRQALVVARNSIQDELDKIVGKEKKFEVNEYLKDIESIVASAHALPFEIDMLGKEYVYDLAKYVFGIVNYNAVKESGIFDIMDEDDYHGFGKDISLLNNEELEDIRSEITDSITPSTYYFYAIKHEGDDTKYFKWSDSLGTEDAEKIINGLKDRGLLKDYRDDNFRKHTEYDIAAHILGDSFEDIHEMLKEIFRSNDPEHIIEKHTYKRMAIDGTLKEGQIRDDFAVADFLAELGYVGHMTPQNFNSGNRKYDSPNYVIYTDVAGQPVLRQELHDYDENMNQSGDETYLDSDFYGRYKTIKNADIYKAELESLEKDFANGKMLDYLEYKRYEGKSDWITAEREAARIAVDGDMIWMQNLLTNVIFDYMETSKFTYDDISEADWEKISQRFIKLANEKLADKEKRKRNYNKKEITDYFNGRDPVKVIRRIFAWSQNTDDATKIRYWQNKYTGRDSKAGDQHILKLARKLKARGDLDDKVLYKDGREASQKYRFLDLVQQDAYNDGNYRTSRVNEAIWAGAQQEILDNSAELMAIDQDVALTSGGKAVRENGIEDSEIEANFLNVTERDLAKARKKAEEAKAQTKATKKELEEALKENDSIKAEMDEVNKTLASTAKKLGVDTEGLETTEDYVEAIKKAGKDIAKEDSKLNKRIETVKDKLKASNEKVRELRNDVLLKDKEISDLKINERVQERKIIRLGNSIAEYIDKLKKERREDAAYRKVVEKTIKDAESAIEAMTDLKVENQELANEIKAKTRTIREQTKELNNTSKLLMKERKTTDRLKKEIDLDNAVIAQLDENLAEAFYNLNQALKDRNKFFSQRNNLEEELNYVRKRRLVENSRRNWHDILRKRSGDATMDRHLETLDKAFFHRNDTFKVLDIDGNKGLKDLISMSGTLDNPDGTKRYVESLYSVLEKNGLIKNGKLVGGFNQLPLGQYKKVSDAIRVARAYADAQKSARVEARAELVRDISNSASADIEKLGLTKDQYKEAKKRYDNGEFETLEMAELKVWQEGLRYKHEGTKSQTDKKKKIGFSVRKGINPNNNVAYNTFTSGYNLLGSISPSLQKLFYFGNADMEGINQVTDNFLKKVEERKKLVEEAVNKEFDGDKKKIRQFYKDTQKRVTTKELDIDHEEAPRWLEMSQTWNNFLETQDYRKDFVDNELTLEEVIGIYEHAKQEEDLAHLLNDRTNLSARQVAWIVNEFEKEDGVFHQYKAIADAYQKAYEYAWDRFQKVANDVYDVALTHYDFYSPARSADNDTDITLGYDFDANGNPLKYGKKMTMKERADMQMKMGGNNPIRLSYISSFNSIVRSQEWFINGAEFFKNWNDIMKNDGGGVRRMIDDRIGSGASDTVMKWMRSVANSEFDDVTSGINKIMDGIRNRMALANLGFSVSSTMQQPSVLFLAASKFGVKNMFKAMQEIKKVGGYKAFRDYVHEMAPQIKASADVNMMYAQQAIRDSKFLKAIGLAQDIAEIGMKGIEFSDQICRCITWQAGYQYYLDKGMTSEEASMYATQDTMNMNSSRQAKDNSLAYNSKNPLWKGLLMFTNQLNKQWNMLIGEDGVQALLRKDIKTFVSTILGLGMATSWVLLAKGKIVNNSDDDEKWWEDLWLDYLGEGISMVPVIGDKISSVINGYSYLDSDLITSMSNFVKAVASKDEDKKGAKITTAWKNVMVDAFELAGAPKVMFKNTYNSLFEDGKWKGEDFFSEGRYWRTILPYEWYQFVTGDKD